jgi:hypothetical protein
MKKLLQIVIPTYNRTVQLQETMNSISTLFHSRVGPRFCVDIFDNSDEDTQKINERIIPKFVNYHKNLSNLGYAGNVKRCLNSNDGKYIWLISDDDILNIDNIVNLLDYLEGLADEVCGVSLNYEVPNIYNGEYDIVNCLKQNNLKISQFDHVLYPDKIPFDFISGFIMRSSILKRIDILNLTEENLYMQSLIYCVALESRDLIAFHEYPVIRWKGDNSLRWPILKLFEDREVIRKLLITRHNVKLNNITLIRNLLKWALLCKVGFVKNTSIEKDRFILFYKVNANFNALNFLLSIFLILPNYIAHKCIAIGFSLFGNRNSSYAIFKKFSYNVKNFQSKL